MAKSLTLAIFTMIIAQGTDRSQGNNIVDICHSKILNTAIFSGNGASLYNGVLVIEIWPFYRGALTN